MNPASFRFGHGRGGALLSHYGIHVPWSPSGAKTCRWLTRAAGRHCGLPFPYATKTVGPQAVGALSVYSHGHGTWPWMHANPAQPGALSGRPMGEAGNSPYSSALDQTRTSHGRATAAALGGSTPAGSRDGNLSDVWMGLNGWLRVAINRSQECPGNPYQMCADLERILGRLQTETAAPRDLLGSESMA